MSRTFEPIHNNENPPGAGDESPGRGAQTRERILDAAERLFAAGGFAATSLRQITKAAKVNLAAVNYHFQSKDLLIRAMLHRRIGPLNRRRIELLAEYEAAAGGRSVMLEDTLRAFLLPMLECTKEGEVQCGFGRILGRLYTEPGEALLDAFRNEMLPIAERFLPAFQVGLPGLSRTELGWGVHFTIGALAHSLAATPLLRYLTAGAADLADREGALGRLVRFTAAGLRAMEKEAKR